MADNTFTHLVLVGSSAGGLGALSGMVSSLPEDFDAPIVVSQHLDPNRESHLQVILARKNLLPVKTVSEHEPLQAGVVYVVLANWHVNITDLEIELRAIPAPAHAFHKPLAGADSLEDAAADVLRTLSENLGWQAALLWAAGGRDCAATRSGIGRTPSLTVLRGRACGRTSCGAYAGST